MRRSALIYFVFLSVGLLVGVRLYVEHSIPHSTPIPQKDVFLNDVSYIRNDLQNYEHKALAGDPDAAAALVKYSSFGTGSEKETVRWLEVAVKNGDAKIDTPGYSRYALARIYIGKGMDTELSDKYPVTPESCVQGRQLLQQLTGDNVIYAKSASKLLVDVPPDCGIVKK